MIDNSKKPIQKSLKITDKTVESILTKLEKFEKTKKFIQQDVSLTKLANNWNTNTRSLSEIIKQYKEKSFSDYINNLRINYIVNLLLNDPKNRSYKISYLAELCGFSSREVFTTVFKKEKGISPSFFIANLKILGLSTNQAEETQQ